MKPFILLVLTLLLVACDHEKNLPLSQKDPPRIEFFECNEPVSHNSFTENIYFNKEVLETGDTTSISFEFVRDCCLEFEGKWKIVDRQLILSYHPIDNGQYPCECRCSYKMSFHFNNNEYAWERIKIKRGL